MKTLRIIATTIFAFACAASTETTPALVFDWSPGISSTPAHRPTPCLDAELTAAGLPTGICAMKCTADLTAQTWDCVKGDGTPVTVTQGSAVIVPTIWGNTAAMKIFADADVPTISSANSGFLASVISSPHTVVWTGYNTNAGSTNFPFEINNGTDVVYMRDESGIAKCVWTNIASGGTTSTEVQETSITVGAGYSMAVCRKALTGASSAYTSRVNGTSVTSTSWGKDPATLGSATVYFGKHSSAGYYEKGQIESVTIYNVAIEDADLDTKIQAPWEGLSPTTSQSGDALSYSGRAMGQGAAWEIDPDGYYIPLGVNVPRVTQMGGYYQEEHSSAYGSGSNWATDNLDASTWTAVGTPTTTTNQASGPFSRYKNAAEADKVCDDDGGAFEGYTAPTSAGASTDRYTCSCFIKQDTSTKARITVTTDGGGAANCDKTLTSSFGRYTCSATITGSPTYVKGQALVGNATSDTGCIFISECQCDRDGWANSPHVTNAGVGIDDMEVTADEVNLWSRDSSKVEVVFRPDFTWATDTIDNEDTYEIFDIFSGNHVDHRVLMWQYQGQNPSIATRGSGGATSTTDTYATSDPSVEAHHLYAFATEREDLPGGKVAHWIYYDECEGRVDACSATSLIGVDITGDKFAPTLGDWGGAQVGCRYSRSLCMAGRIMRARVWR